MLRSGSAMRSGLRASAATIARYHGHRARYLVNRVELGILAALLFIAGTAPAPMVSQWGSLCTRSSLQTPA